MNILTKIKNRQGFTQAEKSLAQWILEDPGRFVASGADEICQTCYVSLPTLYRFCAKLETGGLADLKVRIAADLASYDQAEKNFDFDYPINPRTTVQEIAASLEEDYRQTAILTRNMMNYEDIAEICQAMKEARQIVVFTSAGNLFFARNFQFQMKEIGVNVQVPEDEYVQRLTASGMSENDLAIVISFGGRGAIMSSLCQICQANNVPLALICAYQDNPLEVYAKWKLYMADREDHSQKISSFATRFSLLYLMDVLYSCFFQMDYLSNLNKKQEYYRIMTHPDFTGSLHYRKDNLEDND